ncbi:MAG: TM0106 family RecB-like putative nuclease, partial [Gaiellales bacterium]
MRYDQATQTLRSSATDLANHSHCDYLTQRSRELSIAISEGRAEPPIQTGLAIEKGIAFEAEYVARRRAEAEAAGGRFIDLAVAAAEQGRGTSRATLRDLAMCAGIELIAQAPLRTGTVSGFADLLVRVDDAATPSGTLETVHRYEPIEIKFGRSVRPAYLLQASAYADAIQTLQGAMPVRIHVVTGDGVEHAHVTSEYVEYFRAARERLGDALELDLAEELARIPEPVPHCGSCEFKKLCDARWREVDHLSLVAGIRADQRTKLGAQGITTLTQLATTELEKVTGIGARSLQRLRTQAELQLQSRERAADDAAIAFRDPADEPAPTGRGFAMLPEPDAADMFFDFEGYPYHERGALEYLWGWTTRDAATGKLHFDYIWADTPAEEHAAFTRFLDLVHEHWQRSPGMHIYHYAPYEITALRRLAKEHHHEQHRLDQLLRAGVFVDLFAVVRQALQVGTESYSIKSLEPLYGIDRSDDELADGGASIEIYEQWLTSSDTAVQATILDYNRVDCDSTLALRDWLLAQRADAAAAGIIWPIPPAIVDATDTDLEAGSEDADPHPTRVLVERLEAVAEDETRSDQIRLAARLLSA